MKRVEILEERLSDLDTEADRHYYQVKGDVLTVPDSLAQKWCGYGWARDVDGEIETGERIPGARGPLEVQSMTHNAKSTGGKKQARNG